MTDLPPPKTGYFKLGKHWPYLIVGMLLVHASIMLGTIAYVSSKNDLYVEKDYYAKAIDWDNQRAIKEAADKMGWTVDLIIHDLNTDTQLMRTLEVTLTDRAGDPITRALVEIEAFHPAHANDRLNEVLLADPNAQGTYAASLPIITPGFWQIVISIRHQGTQALVTKEIKIKSP